MSMDKARAHLRRYGLEDRIIELADSSATVELAARALGCEPEHIAKTLSFVSGEGALVLRQGGDEEETCSPVLLICIRTLRRPTERTPPGI